MLFIHEMFPAYKLETFKNCKEANHIIKKKLYDPFLWMGFNCLKASTTLRGQFTIFILVSPQKILVLTLSTLEGQKAELTLELPSDFERGTRGLGIQRLNH